MCYLLNCACAQIERRAVSGLLELIERERQGEMVDRTLLKSVLRMFGSLGIYAESFEKAFLAASEAYYSAEGRKYMEQASWRRTSLSLLTFSSPSFSPLLCCS